MDSTTSSNTNESRLHAEDQFGAYYCYLYFISPVDLVDTMASWMKWVQIICTSFFIVFGLMSNVVSFIVMTMPKMRKCSFAVYLAALAVSDGCNLILHGIFWINFISALSGGPLIIRVSDKVAKTFLKYTSMYFAILSSWLVTLISIERFIVVCFPMSASRLCRRRSARGATCCTVLGVLCVMLIDGSLRPWMDYDVAAGCRMPDRRYDSRTVGVLMIGYVPFFVITFCCVSIVTVLNMRSARLPIAAVKLTNNKVTRLMLFVMAVFLLLLFPTIVTITVVAVLPHLRQVMKFASGPLTAILWEMSYSVNFLIYALTSRKVRETFVEKFLRVWSTDGARRSNGRMNTTPVPP
ncbi:uncharacterized protein LOC141910406 [Tubulanus polymorphus]|uniref:uncharacterized protein LOC141910406 n=1 Tax=Tubulanus polymorphus TaxID=672921 RepID=UPI003DA2CED6